MAYHGDDLKDWAKRAEVLTTWREVVDRYIDDFNVSVLHSDGLFLDLLQNMPTDMWQSAVATLACMALMCATFMLPNFSAILVATLVIASVLLCKYSPYFAQSTLAFSDVRHHGSPEDDDGPDRNGKCIRLTWFGLVTFRNF